jgi:hypothetical protein
MRFRIRRFMKHAGGAAPYRAATPAPVDRTKTSGRQRACDSRPCSTTGRVDYTPSAMPAPPSVRVASACAPARKVASIVATGCSVTYAIHPSRSSNERLVWVSLKYTAQPRRSGLRVWIVTSRWRPRAPRSNTFTFSVSRLRLVAAMRRSRYSPETYAATAAPPHSSRGDGEGPALMPDRIASTPAEISPIAVRTHSSSGTSVVRQQHASSTPPDFLRCSSTRLMRWLTAPWVTCISFAACVKFKYRPVASKKLGASSGGSLRGRWSDSCANRR